MLNIIFTVVVKLVIMNLCEQITRTVSAVTLRFQWSIKTTFNKQPFFVRVLAWVVVCLSVYRWHNSSAFSFGCM